MSDITGSGNSSGPDNFWSLTNLRLDSVVAKVLVYGGGGWVLWKILPIIQSIVWNMVSIAVGCGILTVIGILLIDGRLLKLISWLLRIGVRSIVGLIIPLAPIAIMKEYLADVEKLIQKFSKYIGNLRTAIDQTEENIESFEGDRRSAMAYVTTAERKNNLDDPVVRQKAMAAKDLERSVVDLSKMLAQLKLALSFLERYYDQSVAYRDGLKYQIQYTERKRKAFLIAQNAFSAAKDILSGRSVGAEFYDQALEASKDQAAVFVGEMKQWVYDSQGLLKSFEMGQDAAVEEVLQKAHSLEQRSQESLVLSYQPGTPVGQTVAPIKTAVPVSTVDEDIKKLLD